MLRITLFFVLAVGALVSGETRSVPGVRDLAISPDGRHLALSLGGKIHVVDLESRESWPLAEPGAPAQQHPDWSRDGGRIVFSALLDERFRLFEAPRSAEGARELPAGLDEAWHAREPVFAGASIVFVRESLDGTRSDIMVIESGSPPRPLTTHEARDRMPAASPDGGRIAFVSDRSGDEEIWIVPLEGGDAHRLTHHEGEDLHPRWSSNGARLAYSTERGSERYLAVIDASGGEPSVFLRGGGQAVWLPGDEELLVATMPFLPPAYNGNPSRSRDWPPALPFGAEDAFELRRVTAPRPLDESASILLPELESRAERNRRLFDTVVDANRKLYYREGDARDRFEALADRLRSAALGAGSDEGVEAVVDRLVAARPLIKTEGRSARAVVASGHPLATEAGLAVLRRGGNVVDAAIAISFMLGVVEPDASGIGGEGMMLVHRQDLGTTVAVDFKDQVPMHATPGNPAIHDGARLKSHGPASVNIPGVVAGMELAFEKLGSGRVRWAELVAPAIRAASEGVPATEGLASSIAAGERFLAKYPAAAKIFLPGGRPLRAGEVLVNPDYARTLEAIAEGGAGAFYRGAIAGAIARDMRAGGGILTEEDLAQYRAILREPLVGRYRGFEIVAAPPPVSAGASLLQMLQILDHRPLAAEAHFRRDADTLHYMIEAWKGTSRERLVADPFLWEVDLSEVLSREWARARFQQIDESRASPGPALPEDPAELERYQRERISTGTTAAVVADTDGNLVALTQTLSTWGGAFYVSEGLGFLYNNHLRLFSAPKGTRGSLTPLARAATGICPTLVFRIDAGGTRVPYMALGAAGNAWITASVYEILTGIVDFGLSPQEAVESPRFLVESKRFPVDRPAIPPRVWYEQGIGGEVVAEMRARGHRMEPMGLKGELVMGYAAVAVVDLENQDARAGADPRRSHHAAGLSGPAPP